jgi:hypothetical protein
MPTWDESKYEILFRDRPPTQPSAPTREECELLGRQLGFSPGAITAQWDDGRSAILHQKSAASRRLRDYLVRRGWLA